MFENIISQVKPIFDKVAEKIGQTSEFVWGVLLKQQMVEAVTNCLIALACVFIFITSIWAIKKGFKLSEKNDEWFSLSIIGMIAVVLSFSFFWCYVISGIQLLINPEFYALQFLLSAVK